MQVSPYPTDDELQSNLTIRVNWEAYKDIVLQQIISDKSKRRPSSQLKNRPMRFNLTKHTLAKSVYSQLNSKNVLSSLAAIFRENDSLDLSILSQFRDTTLFHVTLKSVPKLCLDCSTIVLYSYLEEEKIETKEISPQYAQIVGSIQKRLLDFSFMNFELTLQYIQEHLNSLFCKVLIGL